MDLQENTIFAEVTKRSVTYTVKSSANQVIVHDWGHFTKILKKAVQDHKRKPLNVSVLHFLFGFV